MLVQVKEDSFYKQSLFFLNNFFFSFIFLRLALSDPKKNARFPTCFIHTSLCIGRTLLKIFVFTLEKKVQR